MKSLCDKWCIYRFLDGKERLCKATERYEKTVQPVLQCDKYKRFLDSDAETRLEKEIAAANQRIEQMQKIADAARRIVIAQNGGYINFFEYYGAALGDLEKALAELEAK
jgi:uncharacterized membrane protein YccC